MSYEHAPMTKASNTQRVQAIYERTYGGVDRNHAFGIQFAERDMNRPLALTDTAQTIRRQIEALADAHAGIPDEQ